MEFGWSSDETAYRIKIRGLLGAMLPKNWADFAVRSFKAFEHPLALTVGTHGLAMRAAWSDTVSDCAIRTRYLQHAIPTFGQDLRQFCGGMSLTPESPLHYLTYRLKALLGEPSRNSGPACAASLSIWGEAA